MDLEKEIEKLKLRLNDLETQVDLLKSPRTVPIPPTRVTAGGSTVATVPPFQTVFTPRLFDSGKRKARA